MEIVFEGIRNRLSMLPTGLDARLHQISPDGKMLLLTASAARQQNLYTFSLDELATEPPVARQVTSTAGAKTGAQFSPDGQAKSTTWSRAESRSRPSKPAPPGRSP